MVCKPALGAIYDIWHQRNAIIHGKGFGTEESILKLKALSRTESLQYLEFQLEDFAEHFLNGVCLDFGCW